jgi:hypothetical protein
MEKAVHLELSFATVTTAKNVDENRLDQRGTNGGAKRNMVNSCQL